MRWNLSLPGEPTVHETMVDATVQVELLRQQGDVFVFRLQFLNRPQPEIVELKLKDHQAMSLTCEDLGPLVFEAWTSDRWRAANQDHLIEVHPQRHSHQNSSHLSEIRSPMPGRLLKTLVQEKNKALKGQTLLIIEAMKMENEVRAPHDLIVDEICVQTGQSVESGESLLKVTPT